MTRALCAGATWHVMQFVHHYVYYVQVNGSCAARTSIARLTPRVAGPLRLESSFGFSQKCAPFLPSVSITDFFCIF